MVQGALCHLPQHLWGGTGRAAAGTGAPGMNNATTSSGKHAILPAGDRVQSHVQLVETDDPLAAPGLPHGSGKGSDHDRWQLQGPT